MVEVVAAINLEIVVLSEGATVLSEVFTNVPKLFCIARM